MLILLSFVLTGITAFYNFKRENDKYNLDRLTRKEKALNTSLQYFMEENGGTIHQDSLALKFSDVIVEMADVHTLSVNLYDLNGNLLISSTAERFDDLGFDLDMDYTVLKQLITGNERPVVKKKINSKEFSLAYWYLLDQFQRKIAIVNVKYDKKNIDDGELTRFLGQLTQIYVLLFLGASLLAFFLSNYITKSIQRISEQMKVIDLSSDTEPINWKSNDEIGLLVKQYNKMIGKVKRSAELLAKSERESAWREMAKQVAHEIKNPLTPMRLRVQHLLRTLDSDPDIAAEQLKKFSNSMIDQIDTLSGIASEFSNFAKMPKANNIVLNMPNTVKASLDIYLEDENTNVTFENLCDTEPEVFADKDQITRVVNNLVKNAIQATEDIDDPKIEIELYTENDTCLLSVKDNGVGIKPEQREKIFVPNFTTKSTGMGLGLAMVQHIVHAANGDIWFESDDQSGTVFYVSLPLYTSENE